ncbi:MAG: TolB family protein, partial [bacterium]
MIWAGLTAPLNSRFPVVSPDGKYFAYFDPVADGASEQTGGFDLIVSTTAGRMRGRFRTPPGTILWSNAGHVAVIDGKRAEARLIVSTEDRLLILAQIQVRPGTLPVWSRDGNKLAFIRPAAAGDQLAIYDIQQSGSLPVLVPPEFQWRGARLLFWSPGGDALYLLNEEGQEVVLDRVVVQSGKVELVARGFETGKGTAPGLPRLSPDGSKVYLPPPRNAVIDPETGQLLWTLPEGGNVLWFPWSEDGRQLFYFRSSDPTQITAHDFASAFDQVVVSNAWANGVFSPDGRSYYFRAPQEAIPYGLKQTVRAWLGNSWGWQQVDLPTPAVHALG